jgi:hypothetical protein
MTELPFQTYERVTGQRWPGGKSKIVRLFLSLLSIREAPGSAKANLELQSQFLTQRQAQPE